MAVLVLGAATTPGQGGDAYRAGATAFARGDPRTARVYLMRAIDADPGNARAFLLQGRVQLALGDGLAAEAALGRARQAGIAAAAIAPYLAEAYVIEGRNDEALALAASDKVAARLRGYAARVRGQAQAALGDIDAAAAAFNQALTQSPDDADAWIAVARFRRTNGDDAAATAAADRAVALAPRDPDALVLKGEIARAQYGLLAALPWFDRALQQDDANVPALLARAATLGEAGRVRQMLVDTRQALALAPDTPRAFYLQAVLAARARNYPLARRLLQRTNGALADEPATMLLQGVVEHAAGVPEQAIDILGRLVALQPDNVKARRVLAAAQWKAGDVDGTIDTLQSTADRADADSYVLTLIGRAYEAQGKRDLAARYLDRASAPVTLRGGLIDRGAADAVAAARSALALSPGDAAARVAVVRALAESGDAAGAVAAAQAIAHDNPGAPAAHVVLGDALEAAGRVADAAAAYRRAANIAFTEPVALRMIAAYRAIGQGPAAVEALNIFLIQNPESIAGRQLGAEILIEQKQWPRAQAMLEAVRDRIGDRDALLINNLAWMEARTGDPRQAARLAGRARRLIPANPALLDSDGWLLLQAGGNRSRAISLIRQAALQTPVAWGPIWHLAQAYAVIGRKDLAANAARIALKREAFPDVAAAKKLAAG